MPDDDIHTPSLEGTVAGDSFADTRERILDAAERLFAENGFAGTSIRDITTTANCNVAAINYHFRNKSGLYEELFRTHLGRLRDLRIAHLRKLLDATETDPTLERVLYTFIHSFLAPLSDPTHGPTMMRLFQWEILHPTLPENLFYDEMIGPTMEIFQEALLRVCPDLPSDRMHLCIMSVVGQILHLVHMQGFLNRHVTKRFPSLTQEMMINHMVEFSAAGICRFTKGDPS